MIVDELYRYRAQITNVYDGDTCTADIDLGLSIWAKGEKLRLNRIDAKEIRGEEREEGLKARDFLRQILSEYNNNVFIETIKDKKGKYGRYLAEIVVVKEDGTELNINDYLVENGFAEYREY